MFGWFVERMRTYGRLAARFRKAYDPIVDQQHDRVVEQINARFTDPDERQKWLDWAERVRKAEYTNWVPVGAEVLGE